MMKARARSVRSVSERNRGHQMKRSSFMKRTSEIKVSENTCCFIEM
jgi:hypothetical protein